MYCNEVYPNGPPTLNECNIHHMRKSTTLVQLRHRTVSPSDCHSLSSISWSEFCNNCQQVQMSLPMSTSMSIILCLYFWLSLSFSQSFSWSSRVQSSGVKKIQSVTMLNADKLRNSFMTSRVDNWQSASDLNSIRNFCDAF